MAPDLDLTPFKKQYVEKWALGPNDIPCLKNLVDQYLKELDSEYEDVGEENLT